ncbi:ACP S-malonyltransferase [Aliiroseovarius lamellibrachiae]|uniref:ACP S-malonyltransferase n=1 Tax=Aliiroseovarius lamellibrachiae TaxID=1924933 RepID=UPI001BDF96A5|nr:ACP S-malonyltransferase [Aliiroseovarius lamellibrachiae]MBT2129942.1 ACP S-malonyltransferase [Aliiroseovarius lamellibrachiae]
MTDRKQTAVVVAPGRGTYNRDELGYFARHHPDQRALMARFDAFRQGMGQEALSALDGAERFSGAIHTRGDNASGLIHACAYADFLAIDRARFDILAVTGNSMGWYIALACAGALDAMGGLEVVNTMGTLMHEHMIGGQLIYPFVDDDWREIPGARAGIAGKIAEINARADHHLALSIDLGGMLVLAGNEKGLAAFEAEMPVVQSRYPMRLPGHAAFHTTLQTPVAAAGQARLGQDLFAGPKLSMIDGRGAIWSPKSTDPAGLRGYTLGHQVTEPYDFASALRVAAREFMPDVFIVLGPGSTLGGAVAQSLLAANWRGMGSKSDFKAAQNSQPRIASMGIEDQRKWVTG